MTVLEELASYMISLEERVERLKTLEDAPVTAAGSWTYIISGEIVIAGSFLTIGSIPQTYDDLLVIWQARTDEAVGNNRDEVCAQFNGDSTAGNYDTADGTMNTGGSCYKDSGFVIIGHATDSLSTGSADSFGAGVCYIPNYTSTSYKKTTQGFAHVMGVTAAFGLQSHCIGAWNTYNAITSIKFFPRVGTNFVPNTIFELYGLTR